MTPASENVSPAPQQAERTIEFYLVATPAQQRFVDWAKGIEGAAGELEVHGLQAAKAGDVSSAASALMAHLLRQAAPTSVRVFDLRDLE